MLIGRFLAWSLACIVAQCIVMLASEHCTPLNAKLVTFYLHFSGLSTNGHDSYLIASEQLVLPILLARSRSDLEIESLWFSRRPADVPSSRQASGVIMTASFT